MMGIAAKISRGEWRDGWVVWGEESGGVEKGGEMEVEEDDYGFEIRRTPSSLSLKSDASGSGSEKEKKRGRRSSFDRVEIPGSWEVD